MNYSKQKLYPRRYEWIAIIFLIGGLVISACCLLIVCFNLFHWGNSIIFMIIATLLLVAFAQTASVTATFLCITNQSLFRKNNQTLLHPCYKPMDFTTIQHDLTKSGYDIELFGPNELIAHKVLKSSAKNPKPLNCWVFVELTQTPSHSYLCRSSDVPLAASDCRHVARGAPKTTIIIHLRLLDNPLVPTRLAEERIMHYSMLEEGIWVNSLANVYCLNVAYDMKNSVFYYADGLERIEYSKKGHPIVKLIDILHSLVDRYL